MIKRMGDYFAAWAHKYITDPFLFAIILTFVTVVLGLIFTDNNTYDMVIHWGTGFWDFLSFAMQMCLILVTGYALATAKPVKKMIAYLAGIPKSPGGAVAYVAFFACVAGLINWGFGLILGAYLAREVAVQGRKRNIPMHYPLLGAAGYSGLLVWHGGFSGSAPLVVAEANHFLVDEIGIVSTGDTILSSLNIITALLLLLIIPLIYKYLSPTSESEIILISPEQIGEDTDSNQTDPSQTLATKMENSPVISIIIGVMGFVYILHHFIFEGKGLGLNIVNFIFLFAGIILHWRPISYIRAIAEGTKGASGIILQFPFYAGILGMMKHSGLILVISNWFTSISTSFTFPIFAFFSAGLVNLFVPSGGGQWGVQGPIMVEAAKQLGVSIPKTIMAVAYGDQWTNMLQPFWALPLLGITGLKARDIIGYTMVVMFLTGLIFILALTIL